MKFPKDIFLAHTAETTEGALRAHELAEHLRHVAAGAAANAAHFGGEDWARLAGLWHDLGKYRPGFQRYIRECVDGHIEGRTPSPEKTHSAAGALHALAVFERIGGASGKYLARVLAYLIAGHHAGLADWSDSDAHIGLSFRLDKPESNAEYTQALDKAPDEITAAPSALPSLRNIPGGSAGLALWVRMLFSCLVDADFLDTERFMDADKADRRSGAVPLSDMLAVCDAFMTRKAADAPASHVNTLRAGILAECRRAAELPPGVFSLEVPTGGGKTLSSLAFALSHAVRHGKRRVIYAIPYTSIIEQTADVFRQVFAELGEVVVEHHSQAEADEREDTARSRLACENWDAPLIVTTNVQLFESLFAARTSRCRKLHNLVGSVIVLDEAQQLPPEFLQPILDALRLLVTHYGVTVVLCTATQPALGTTHFFGNNLRGLDNIRPIIAKPDALFTQLKRVRVHLPADMHTPTPWPVIAAQIAECDSVLAIVNTRKQARELHRLLPAGTLHLSNRMCGAHKARVIQEIKARLKAKRAGEDIRPLRIVSTSLIEAGVDLDVPVVFRALAGLDSLAQAAGRCNREGLLDGLGEVFLFIPPEAAPVGLMRKAADACISTLHGISGSPLDRALFEPYFRTYYRAIDTDKHRIGDLLTQNAREVSVAFRTAADRFRLIDDADTASVVVRYRAEDDDTVGMLLNTLAKNGPERWLMRKLQRYIVNIQEREASRLLQQGDIALIPAMPGLYLQANDLLYDHTTGLVDDTKPVKPCLLVL
jgi:CRISPR-associated endonuclease/helicase Cas3